jgi:hypothetical protein
VAVLYFFLKAASQIKPDLMKIPDFQMKDDLNDYLNSPFNVLKYQELTFSTDYRNLFIPLDFFNLLWQTHSLIRVNKLKPLKISKHVLSLPISPDQLNYFCENLILSFNKIFNPCSNHHDDHELNICLDVLLGEFKKSGFHINHPAYGEKFILDFSQVKKNVDSLPGNLEKIEYLNSAKTYYLESGDSASALLCVYEIRNLNKLEKIRKLKNPVQVKPETSSLVTSAVKTETIKAFITDKINCFGFSKWKYFFFSEEDCNYFVELLSNNYSGVKIETVREICFQPRCKSNLCKVIYSSFTRFKNIPLKKDPDFLGILQHFSMFKGQSPAYIYEYIRKHGSDLD